MTRVFCLPFEKCLKNQEKLSRRWHTKTIMTIYEQIQNAIHFIEKNLFMNLSQKQVAKSAGMSVRSFTKWFWAVTGFSYKEYIVRRRLSEAQKLLEESGESVLEIALSVGYQSHESFSRAFKKEFGVSPVQYRRHHKSLSGIGRIKLYKELYMGVVIKELPRMKVMSFEGFAPQPEIKAKTKLLAWMKKHSSRGKPGRIFGHNIDEHGRFEHFPQNVGYKFMISIEDKAEGGKAKVEIIEPGRFAVTGIEGNIDLDPAGKWIIKGWEHMFSMIKEKGYRIKRNARAFEEELEPEKSGNLRLDLYLEIE